MTQSELTQLVQVEAMKLATSLGFGAAAQATKDANVTNSRQALLDAYVAKKIDGNVAAAIGGELGIADYTGYSVISLTSASSTNLIRLTDPSFQRKRGVTNINQGQLEKSEAAAIVGIRLVGAVVTYASGATQDTINAAVKKAKFAPIASLSAFDALSNGEAQFKLNTRVVLEKMQVSNFTHVGEKKQINAAFFLDSPKIINPKEDIDFSIETDGGFVIAADTTLLLKVEFLGSKTTL